MEVERPKPAPYADPEPTVSPWRVALVLFAFTLPITGSIGPVAFVVAWVGAFVLLALVIGSSLAYAAPNMVPPHE